MPINSFLYPGAKVTTGYNVDNSLRFERSSSDYLSKTFGSGGNRKTATQSFWLKRSLLSTNMMLGLTNYPSGSYYGIQALTDDVLDIYLYYNGSAWEGRLKTNRVFRDVSSWYHFVLAWDTTQSTASDRLKFYVNGVQETSFSVETYPDQNQDLDWNNNIAHQIMSGGGGTFSGYLAEMVFIDGQQLDPTSFGEFDSDSPTIWKPIDVSGLTFGNNGFYLDFENSGSLGADVSGNGNNFTVNNLTSIDQSTDTCTNNFATMNPLDNFYQGATFSEGNLLIATASSPYTYNTANMGMSSGKWYWEGKAISVGSGNSAFGIISTVSTAVSDEAPNKTDSAMYKDDGVVRRNNGNGTSIGAVNNNDIVSFAYDADNNFIYFALNGTWQNSGDPTSGASGTGGYDPGNVPASTATGFYFPMFSDHNSGSGFSMSFNFGSPSFAISSGNTDGNGYGNFEYSVPSGYYSLNSKNLAEFG